MRRKLAAKWRIRKRESVRTCARNHILTKHRVMEGRDGISDMVDETDEMASVGKKNAQPAGNL